MASHAPMTVSSSGQQIASGLPLQHPGFTQNLAGGPIHAAATKTQASIAAQASHAKALGATIRGGKRKMRGGANVEFHPMQSPEGGSIPGVSSANNTGSLLQAVNELRTGATYDHLVGTQSYKVKLGGRKRRRNTKKHGSRKHGSHRRSSRKRSHRTRRNSHSRK